MPSREFEVWLDRLRSVPRVSGRPVTDQRITFEDLAATFTLPSGVEFTTVDAGGVPCEWSRVAGAPTSGVILYLHGGGYCLGSVLSYRNLAARLSLAAQVACLTVEYRLAPEHPFPAALEDATKAYFWLLDQGIAPEGIVLAGDSAGGGLAISTLLVAKQRGRPLPAALVCFSPSADHTKSGESMTRNAMTDPIISPEGTRQLSDAYMAGADPRNPLISPVYADLSGFPPALILVGTNEVLLDDSLLLARRLAHDGCAVKLEAWKDMVHIWPYFIGAFPEAQAAVDAAAGFIRSRIYGTD